MSTVNEAHVLGSWSLHFQSMSGRMLLPLIAFAPCERNTVFCLLENKGDVSRHCAFWRHAIYMAVRFISLDWIEAANLSSKLYIGSYYLPLIPI